MNKQFLFDSNKDNKIQCNNESVGKNECFNVDSIYQKALQKIECDSKNKPCCCAGIIGPTGPAGTSGILNFADFYALMPPDNAATVAPGTDVSFPQDGPNSGSGIVRTSASSFNLADIGTYQVLFQVSVDEAGKLVLTLNGNELAYTVVGRATGTSQIIEMAIVTTTSINSILTVRNPADNPAALTITPLAGGAEPISAHLVILQIQ